MGWHCFICARQCIALRCTANTEVPAPLQWGNKRQTAAVYMTTDASQLLVQAGNVAPEQCLRLIHKALALLTASLELAGYCKEYRCDPEYATEAKKKSRLTEWCKLVATPIPVYDLEGGHQVATGDLLLITGTIYVFPPQELYAFDEHDAGDLMDATLLSRICSMYHAMSFESWSTTTMTLEAPLGRRSNTAL